MYFELYFRKKIGSANHTQLKFQGHTCHAQDGFAELKQKFASEIFKPEFLSILDKNKT